MDGNDEILGLAIDHLDNVTHGLQLPLSAEFHFGVLKTLLPEIVKELKSGFVAVTGENPWEGQPDA